jgi:hypothetical protein
MATVFSSKGASRPAPAWWRNLERGMLIILIPAATAIIQGWGFKNEMLALKLNLIINTGLVAIIKFIGMTILDPNDNYISNLSEADQSRIKNIDIPPVEKPNP